MSNPLSRHASRKVGPVRSRNSGRGTGGARRRGEGQPARMADRASRSPLFRLQSAPRCPRRSPPVGRQPLAEAPGPPAPTARPRASGQAAARAACCSPASAGGCLARPGSACPSARRRCCAGIAIFVWELILGLARENTRWGYRRIQGELLKLSVRCSHETIRGVLRRHGLPPALLRSGTSWRQFPRQHAHQMLATDFFTVDTVWLQRCTCFSSSSLAVAASTWLAARATPRPSGWFSRHGSWHGRSPTAN